MPITIKVPTGKRINVDADTALIGRDHSCQIALPDEPALQPIHARIKKVANRWLIESQGDWQLQVGAGLPGRMSWLMPGDVIRLTETGPEITFDEASGLVPIPAAPALVPKAPKPQAPSRPRPAPAPAIAAAVEPTPESPAMVEEWFYASRWGEVWPVLPGTVAAACRRWGASSRRYDREDRDGPLGFSQVHYCLLSCRTCPSAVTTAATASSRSGRQVNSTIFSCGLTNAFNPGPAARAFCRNAFRYPLVEEGSC